MMNKIAIFIPEFPGQTHTFFWNEAKALKKLGRELVIFSTQKPEKNTQVHAWSKDALKETNFLFSWTIPTILSLIRDVLFFNKKQFIQLLRLASKYKTHSIFKKLKHYTLTLFCIRLILKIKKKNITHIHVHSYSNCLTMTHLIHHLEGISYSVTLHNQLDDIAPEQIKKFESARFIVTITEELKYLLLKQLPSLSPNRVIVAPMGIDTQLFKRKKALTVEKFTKKIRLVSCGRLNPGKGFSSLIDVVACLSKEDIPVQLTIIGGGGSALERKHEWVLRKKIKSLGLSKQIQLLGSVPNEKLVRYLENASIFILLSHQEGLGMAIVEAMSMQLPVIGSDRGGIKKLVVDSVTGYRVSPTKIQESTKAIKTLINNPKKAIEMGKKGREKIESRYSYKKSAKILNTTLSQKEGLA